MKPSAYPPIVRIAWTCMLLSLLLVCSTTGQAQEENLLTNPGFEAPFQIIDGNSSLEVAQGWVPWHTPATGDMPSWQNAQPVYGQTAPDVTRIRSGNNAQQYYNDTWHTHEGGVYQRVTGITPGAELRFAVYAYVWSSSQEDVNVSEDPGGVTLQVGIDPTGDTDPQSSNIVWSFAVSQYDAYREYSVITTAVSNAVTVFVRSAIDTPVANTFIYLDDATLAETVAPVSPTTTFTSTSTATPTATSTNTLSPEPSLTEDNIASPTIEEVTTMPPAVTTVAPPVATTAVSPIVPTVITGTVTSPFRSTITHIVRRGETVSRLAVLYGSSIQAIIEANNLNEDALIYVGQGLTIPVALPAPATSTPSPTPIIVTATPGAGTTYIVRPGDTLYRIAVRFNLSPAAIAQANGIVNVNLIQAGQELIIPATGSVISATAIPAATETQPTTYIVRPGDNLYRISLRFGVSMLALSEANGILNVNRLFAGQVLIIP